MMQLVLASGSATRQHLLREAGIAFVVELSHVDEASVIESLVAEKAKPRDVADLLAELKSVRVSNRCSGALVLGGDQVLSLGARIFQKPAGRAEAREQLMTLRGHTHTLSTAVCVSRNGSVIWREVREAQLTMRNFSEGFLDSYLDHAGEDILGSVGGYQVEKLGIQLFSRIDGDHFTILGLPLLGLLGFLRTQGVLPE
ncbi:MAG: Maf family protein [Alphaproteobacteria bacterium]|nr:Maf family protein [Alphaproteobacteria bacterium]